MLEPAYAVVYHNFFPVLFPDLWSYLLVRYTIQQINKPATNLASQVSCVIQLFSLMVAHNWFLVGSFTVIDAAHKTRAWLWFIKSLLPLGQKSKTNSDIGVMVFLFSFIFRFTNYLIVNHCYFCQNSQKGFHSSVLKVTKNPS